jgi:hypothetical protein
MRKHAVITPRQYAAIAKVGLDAAYQDLRQCNIESIRVGKRKLKIPAVAVEKRFGLNPGDLDAIIDAMKSHADGTLQ